MKDRICLHPAVVANVLAVGPLRFSPTAFIEVALQYDFSIGGHFEINADTLDHWNWGFSQPPHQGQLVLFGGHSGCRDAVRRMRANDKGHRHAFFAREIVRIHHAQIARRDHIDTSLAWAAQHETSIADVPLAPVDASADVNSGRDVRSAIFQMLQMHW